MTGSSDAPAIDETLVAAEALDAEIAGAPIAGQTPGAPSEPEAPDIDTAELLATLMQPAFAIMAPAWEVAQHECKALADAWAPVIDKYFPGLSMGVELNAALITLAVIGPRLGKSPKPPAQPKAEGEKRPAAGASIPPGFEDQAR